MGRIDRGHKMERDCKTEVQVVEAVAEFSEGTDLLREEVATTEEDAPVNAATLDIVCEGIVI